eukprot:2119545-Rhodomonas_salina.1
MPLRACHAVSGTQVVYGDVVSIRYATSDMRPVLLACARFPPVLTYDMLLPLLTYAMLLPGSRSDLLLRYCDGPGGSAIFLRACYAVPGTDIAHTALLSAYALATRCPVLTEAYHLPLIQSP